MDILGIGANMVKSLRCGYKLSDLLRTLQERNIKPLLVLEKSSMKMTVIEEIGTLWFLHYKLATNGLMQQHGTIFNEFNRNEFNKDDFVKQLNTYIMLKGSEVSERSLDDDFNCIMHLCTELSLTLVRYILKVI